MAQEAFVILIYVVVDDGILPHGLLEHRMAKALEHPFEDGLVEDHALAVDDALHVAAGEQFAALEYDAVGAGVESVDPELLVEHFAREDEHMDFGVAAAQLAAHLHSGGGGAAEAEVEEDEVGLVVAQELPQLSLVHGCADDLRFGYVRTEYFESAFHFEGHVFNNYHLKLFHLIVVISVCFANLVIYIVSGVIL